MNKTCKKCNENKPVSEFYKKKICWSKDDGYDYYCKKCRNWLFKKNYHTNKVKCTIEDCQRPHYAKGQCRSHYDKAKRNREKGQNK